MREIKFKAKNLNGEWVYGYYWSADNKYYISNSMGFGYRVINNDTEIDPDTLCQYTGLKDKYGTEIYENDKMFDEYYEEYGTIEWDENTAMFIVSFDGWCTDFDHINEKDLEVVGSKLDEEEEDVN